MRIKVAVVFFSIFLAGCATVRKGQDVQTQQLQNRINYLETELQAKNQEISSLEYELERQQGERLSSAKQKESDTIQMSAKQIQTALKNTNFYQGAIDGKAGPKTKEAIKAFQKARGLKADGVAGKRTQAELKKYLKNELSN